MLRYFVLALIANSLGLYLVDYFLVDFCFIAVDPSSSLETCPEYPTIGPLAYILGGFLLGILNLFLKPFLKIITLPITFLTAGLFLLVVNGLILATLVWLVQTLDLEIFTILLTGSTNFLTYALAAIVLGIFNLLTHWLIKR